MNKTAARWCFIVWLVVGFLTIRLNAQPPATADPVGPSHLKRLTNVFLYADRGIDVGDWGIAFDPTDTVPTTPLKGNIYYDLSQNSFQFYDGSAWKYTGVQGVTGVPPSSTNTYKQSIAIWEGTDGISIKDSRVILTNSTDDLGAHMYLPDDSWIGLGTGKARIDWNDTSPDEIAFHDANVRIGTSAPGKATIADMLYVEHGIEADGDIYLADGKTIGLDGSDDTEAQIKFVRDSTDEIQFALGLVKIGTGTPAFADGDDDLYVKGNLEVIDNLGVEGVFDLGTVEEFGESDETPNVSSGSYFKTHATTDTITNFDDGGDSTTLINGQIITVFSKGAITFDSSTHLRSGSANLVTANGDLTVWMYDGADWVLLSFMDDSVPASLSSYALKVSGTLTTPSIVTSLTVTDEDWIGLASDGARIKYDDESTDVLSVLSASVRVGAGTPTVAGGADDLYATGDLEADGILLIEGVSYLHDNIEIQDDKSIGISSGPEIEFDETGTDAIELLGANVRVGNGTPGTATGLEDLYVESDLEVDGNITGGTFKSVYVDEFFIWIDADDSVGPSLTQIEFDTEVYDPDGVADIADPWEVTFNGTGMCTICGYVSIKSGSIVNDEVNQVLYKNGSQYLNLYSTAQGNAPGVTQSSGGGSCVSFYNDSASHAYTIYVSHGESSSKQLKGEQPKNYLMGYRLPE